MLVFVLSLALVALFFICLSVRILFRRGGEFRGTCSSYSPWLKGKGSRCGVCGQVVAQDGLCRRDASNKA